jgi:hypothetical protein
MPATESGSINLDPSNMNGGSMFRTESLPPPVD